MANKMKAAYWQRGEAIDYKNETGAAIEAGEVVSIGYLVGVAGCDIPKGETGSLHIEGTFHFPKESGTAFALGDRVCLKDGKLQKHADGDSPVGIVVEKPAENAENVLVKINV